MSEATDTDYWFLRDNGLNAKTTLRILAIAYKGEEKERPLHIQTEEEWFEENAGIGEEL